MKKLTLSRLRSLAPQPKKKVQKLAANAAHRLTPPAFEDYDEEPSTRLSTAFVVVLILHLVAVGGIYAFHSIKAHRHEAEIPVAAEVSAQAKPGNQAPVVTPNAGVAAVAKTPGATVVAPLQAKVPVVTATSTAGAAAQTPVAKTPVKPEQSGPSAVLPQQKQAPVAVQASPAPAANAGVHPDANGVPAKTYTVVKGDNPVVIAKRLGVAEEELLKLNGISDPKKLQIGQVLKVPAKKGTN